MAQNAIRRTVPRRFHDGSRRFHVVKLQFCHPADDKAVVRCQSHNCCFILSYITKILHHCTIQLLHHYVEYETHGKHPPPPHCAHVCLDVHMQCPTTVPDTPFHGMGLVNLVCIPAESDDIITQVDDSHSRGFLTKAFSP